MAVDTDIENAVATVIAAAIPAATVDARKILVLREGEADPRIMVKCQYDRAQAGHPDTDAKLNCFYILTVRMVVRNNKAKTGDETLKNWRDIVKKALFGPTLSGVSAVDDIKPIRPRLSALPQLPAGVDSEVIQFEVETYEPLT